MIESQPPQDDALTLYSEVVQPTVAEFMAQPHDKRRGCLAAFAVASLTEHYFHARAEFAPHKQPALNKLKTQLRKENATIGLIADVANATKHVVPWNDGMWRPYSEIALQQLNRFGATQFGWPFGSQEVVVRSNANGPDGQTATGAWRLSATLDDAMRFWRNKLGLADETGAPPSPIGT